jgi:hypothetical protein
MGTRYEDQPVEHWAGPGSLDPTPVWKQYALVAVFVIVTLLLIAGIAYSALAVELATPPASVIGGRVVLAVTDTPGLGEPARRYGAPLVDDAHAFSLQQTAKGEYVAIVGSDGRYLVSVEGTKVIVNTSRVIYPATR